MNPSYQYVFLELLWVNPLLSVHNVAVPLHHTHQFGTLATEVPTSMHPYIAKPLKKREGKGSHKLNEMCDCAVVITACSNCWYKIPGWQSIGVLADYKAFSNLVDISILLWFTYLYNEGFVADAGCHVDC